MISTILPLSLIVFLPGARRAGAGVLPARQATRRSRYTALAVTIVTFLLSLGLFLRRRRRRSSRPASPRCRTCSPRRGFPSFSIQYFMGLDGISFPLVVLTTFLSMLAMRRQLADHQAREGLLHSVPAARNGHARRLHGARLLPVLRLLGSDAAADVLPHRRLGRPAARIRGDQVLPVHAGRQRADADRHPDALLQQRSDAAEPATTGRTPAS